MNKLLLPFAGLLIAAQCASAQTSGPSAPEVQRFTPNSVKQLVNTFTGEFNYNIPLLELDGGYPVNLSYGSSVGMHDEASGTGFGWQLNIGQVTRAVRGLPDDFNGEQVTRSLYQRSDWNIGIGAGLDAEFFGGHVKLGPTAGLIFSNLRGVDVQTNLNASISKTIGSKSLSAGLSIGSGTQDGTSISPDVGLDGQDFSLHLGGRISKADGLKYLGMNASSLHYLPSGRLSFPLLSARRPFTPPINFPMSTTSGSFTYRFGGAVWGFSGGGQVYGQFAVQSLKINVKPLQAYGYLYLQNMTDQGAVMDIGSEKEGPVFEEDQNLSLTYLANDIYSVSAQGLSGTFRPFRTDFRIARSENQNNNNMGASIGLELHGGGYIHDGLNITANISHTFSGKWRDQNLGDLLEQNGNAPVYFKNIGETNGFSGTDTWHALGDDQAVAFKLNGNTLSNSLNGMSLPLPVKRPVEPANTQFSYLTEDEARMAGLQLSSYSGHLKATKLDPIPADDARKPHHLSVIRVTKDDGMIYEFGLAAYNIQQKEVSYNVKGAATATLFQKTVPYDQKDASPANERGRAHYYTVTETPAYAYAYLLTAVYSPDYVDVTGNGPSSDDLGTYTKFNYTRSLTDYRWRTPYAGSNYAPGNLADTGDDMATYVYGVKEVWNIHSMETKNYLAEFYQSQRSDGKEVAGEAGGQGRADHSLLRIDSIKLYTRGSLDAQQPVPLKTVHLDYDYSLCPNTPSNAATGTSSPESGKLTLKQLYFTYGNSKKGKLSPYRFTYNNEHDLTTAYNEVAVDCWGDLKPVPADTRANNIRFPFAEQTKAAADQHAGTWALQQMSMPGGGTLTIDYEAKDYAYVQDRPVRRMFRIVGFTDNPANVNHTPLYNNASAANNYVVVDLEKAVPPTELKHYLPADQLIYIDAVLKIGTVASANGIEDVAGHFAVDSIQPSAENPNYAVLHLVSGTDRNPVARALWQKMRKELPAILFPSPVDEHASMESNIINVVGSLPGNLAGYLQLFRSFDGEMIAKGHGSELAPDYVSFVRLVAAEGRKFGSGSRVRRIRLSDNWDRMSSGPAAVYGREYSYDRGITENGVTRIISSGVATYEPIGNMENPFVVPAGTFNGANLLAEDLYYYKNEPFGESFFPSPNVGYGQVTIRDILDKDVKNNGTGFETDEYYTAQDFPTKVSRTLKQGNVQRQYLFVDDQHRYTASQGFAVELNDMHGKLKAHKLFSAGNALVPVASTEYLYQRQQGHLDNMVRTIDPVTGRLKNQQVGLDYDLHIGVTESESSVQSPTAELNLDVIPAVFGIPFPVGTLLPGYSQSAIAFKGITTTKVIYRSGLLSAVRTVQDGVETLIDNRLYDALSGNVVVTSTPDNYGEPVYTTLLPAYWFYPGMGPAASARRLSAGSTPVEQLDLSAFHGGDELLLISPHARRRAWVYEDAGKNRSVMNEKGALITGSYPSVLWLRPGLRNQQSLQAGKVITKSDPAAGDFLSFSKVIDASAMAYRQHWQSNYGMIPDMPVDSCNCTAQPSPLGDHQFIFGSGWQLRSPADWQTDGSVLSLHTDSCVTTITLDRAIDTRRPVNEAAQLSLTAFQPVTDSCCRTGYQATGTYLLHNGSTDVRGTYRFSSTCYPALVCKDTVIRRPDLQACNIASGIPVNPYLNGLLGNWRGDTTYRYLTDRKYTAGGALKDQGFYSNFQLCLTPAPGFKFGTPVRKGAWQPQDMAVVLDPRGRIVESLNALHTPNSVLHGYGYEFPVASADNTNYYEMAYDGFEDYDFLVLVSSPLAACKLPAHFRFEQLGPGTRITDGIAHTGQKSLEIAQASPAVIERAVYSKSGYPFPDQSHIGKQYILGDADVLIPFSPVTGARYVLSAWMSEQRDIGHLDAPAGYIRLYFKGSSGNIIDHQTFHSKGPLVDNWQQLSAVFTVPAGTAKLVLEAGTVSGKAWLDDIRLQPFDSKMKSYVYDPFQLKLSALLDEQNYATFYEYDQEGTLIRIKKETEKGIVTLQESRTAKPKLP